MTEETNVVEFPWVGNVDLDADRVLDEAKGKLGRVLIMGWEKSDEDGEEVFYTNTSFADAADMMLLMEMTKDELLANIRRAREERGK